MSAKTVSLHLCAVLQTLIPDINTNVLKSESVLDLNIHAASDDLTEDDKPEVTQEDVQDEEESTDVKIKRTVLQVTVLIKLLHLATQLLSHCYVKGLGLFVSL